MISLPGRNQGHCHSQPVGHPGDEMLRLPDGKGHCHTHPVGYEIDIMSLSGRGHCFLLPVGHGMRLKCN